jgi:DNA-binding transcriptional MerR regulator
MLAELRTEEELDKDDFLVSIREASRIVGVPPHTIRYWEKEFSEFLHPPRTTGKQRRYGDDQLGRLKTIFRMLKEEGYSIAGARRALARQNQAANVDGRDVEMLSSGMAEKILALVKNELQLQY